MKQGGSKSGAFIERAISRGSGYKNKVGKERARKSQ